jgi:hypothetical protein
MSIQEFLDFVTQLNGERPAHQRLGQWAFNLLAETHKDIAEEIRATECDAFFVDSKLPAFLMKVLEHVKDERSK